MTTCDTYLEFRDGSIGAIRNQPENFVETICDNDHNGLLGRHGIKNFWITDNKSLVLGRPPDDWAFGHADYEN
jgi:hypothetical protein